MRYRNLRECVNDLERHQQLVRIPHEIDPHLVAAEIQRRAYAAGAPAILFERVTGSPFPMLCNLFGTLERARFLFRETLQAVRRLVDLKIDPARALQAPFESLRALPAAWTMQPRFVRTGPILQAQTQLDQLPALTSWPRDGGPFITLPAVYTEHPERPGWQKSNLGMYRVQLSGNRYQPNRQVGMHYQIHRSIGVHHAAAIRQGKPLPVNVYVGGPPALILSAVMPLPEGLSELTFAGALGGRRIELVRQTGGLPLIAQADFCLSGSIDPQQLLPEGPFGDHLGYYSLQHDFPVMQVERVWHRRDAIWPFTVVGRPPQEDTTFGTLIHEITGPVIPSVLPGVKAVHAVDAAGVHPLLLAIGSERYVPYARQRRPQEILTQAHAILGQGQLSLAKYLLIVAQEDDPSLDVHDIGRFLQHLLQRVDWSSDLHFETRTTIDTLDYTGSGLNAGSKVVIACAGEPRRTLGQTLPRSLQLPDGFESPQVVAPGILAVQAPACRQQGEGLLARFCREFHLQNACQEFPLIVLVDDAAFTARNLNQFLWVTFTRSNPASDLDGIDSSIVDKHWGCQGPLVIDARIKPHHAPPLVEDPDITRQVDELAAPGGPLHGIL
jgi:4-hydroxy-3-polyprenylbenzoate decarboxylase